MKTSLRHTLIMLITLNVIPVVRLIRLMRLHTNTEFKEETEMMEPAERVTTKPVVNDTPSICASWDQNMDKWWGSHPDWSLTFENDTHYCFAPMEDKAKAKFFRRLHDVQQNGNCSRLIVKEMWSSGWGADFGNVNDALLFALESKFPVQMHTLNQWHYAANKKDGSRPVCPRKDLSCYFLNISACEVPADIHITRENFVNGMIARKRSFYFRRRKARWAYEYATRQQTWLRRAVYEYSAKIKLSSPCAAMHVRRSDVALHGNWSRKYHEIQEYVDAAAQHNLSLHNRSIFLLTDDQNAVDEAISQFPYYKWVYLDRPRHRGAEGGWENQIPSNDPKQEVLAILATFRLVQQCDALIHSTSSFSHFLWHYMKDPVRINLDLGKEDEVVYNSKYSKKRPT